MRAGRSTRKTASVYCQKNRGKKQIFVKHEGVFFKCHCFLNRPFRGMWIPLSTYIYVYMHTQSSVPSFLSVASMSYKKYEYEKQKVLLPGNRGWKERRLWDHYDHEQSVVVWKFILWIPWIIEALSGGVGHGQKNNCHITPTNLFVQPAR